MTSASDQRTVQDRSLGEPMLYTVAEACMKLRISRWTLYRLIHSQQLLTIKIGRRRLIPAAAITAYVERSLAEGD